MHLISYQSVCELKYLSLKCKFTTKFIFQVCHRTIVAGLQMSLDAGQRWPMKTWLTIWSCQMPMMERQWSSFALCLLTNYDQNGWLGDILSCTVDNIHYLKAKSHHHSLVSVDLITVLGSQLQRTAQLLQDIVLAQLEREGAAVICLQLFAVYMAWYCGWNIYGQWTPLGPRC
jgi:hypothetical protein